MEKIVRLLAVTFLISILLKGNYIYSQTADEWQQDINVLVNKIETYHPMPWARISQKEFESKSEQLKSNLKNWDKEKTILEILKLVASIQDGHTQVLLDNLENFNRWFPLRIEKFTDGLFITGIEKSGAEFLKSRITRIGNYDIETAYKIIGEIIASDSEIGKIRRITNYFSNAVVLRKLGVIDNEDNLTLETICSDGSNKKVVLKATDWKLSFAWAYDKKEVPTSEEKLTIFENTDLALPVYLSGFFSSKDPFWYEYSEKDKLIYYQINQFFDGSKESLFDFTKKVLSLYDEKVSIVDKLVIDLRFNEGGNSDVMLSLVDEFKQRKNSLNKGKLFIITGNNTFSAASGFIAQMLKTTNAITVGEIADGPLNMSCDPIMFFLPNTKLLVNISRLYSQEGEGDPTDKRGYYPPDYYIPLKSYDYFSFSDPVLDAIKKNTVKVLKDILYKEGINSFKTEFNQRERLFGSAKSWFPYTSYDLALYVYEQLIPSKKYEEALFISEINTGLYPESIWGWFIQGMIYENIGNLSEAYNCFNNLLKIEPYHLEAKWEQEKIGAMLYPFKVDEHLLIEYSGDYNGRRIALENGKLIYQIGPDNKRNLIPISEKQFLIENSNYRVEFISRNKKVAMIKVIKWDGKTQLFVKFN